MSIDLPPYSNYSPTPFPTYFPSLCFTAFLFILRWSLTTLRHATSRMASHSAKRYTQVNLKHPQAHPLVSSDVPSASGNPSPSRNIQDSSKSHNDTAAKSKRDRTYPDKEGDGRTASSADRKRLGSKRPGVEQDTGKAESSPPSAMHYDYSRLIWWYAKINPASPLPILTRNFGLVSM